jgi:nucleotide-binding universal stress UspA family protein
MVPVDGSPLSEQALRYAGELAQRMNAIIHLVKVQSNDRLPGDPLLPAPAERLSRRLDREYLGRLAEELEGVVVTAVLKGPVVESLADYIASTGIDLVVMTTHGKGGLSRAWLGSVADQLVRHVSVPALLLRPQERETAPKVVRFTLDHILIPLDGSAESERAIQPAIALGALTGARFTLVRVVAPLLPIPGAEALPLSKQLADHEALRASASAYLDHVAARLRARGYSIDTMVVIQPQCAAGIIEQAAVTEANLIAMATHGRSGIQRLRLGSVADKVMRGTSLPVLLLRPNEAGLALPISA